MTLDELDWLWQKALHESVQNNEKFIRYRFADLVAEKEREECAKVCDETTASWTQHTYNSACNDCAAAIRARNV